MLVWLSVWGEVQICSCHCHSLYLAPVNPDWFYLSGFTFAVPAHPGTHTHTQPFYGFLEFVKPVPEGTFRHVLDFLEQNEDNTGRRTNNLDGLAPYPD